MLTFDGRESWTPPHPADKPMLQAFLHHQRGDKGFGPAAGPDATDAHGRGLPQDPASPSRPATAPGGSATSQRELVEALTRGIADAVIETGQIDAGTRRRMARGQAQRASGLIGHLDLWARPV